MAIQGKHVVELDGVRGLACLLVMVLHVVVAPLSVGPLTGGTEWAGLMDRAMFFLSFGVDLFFILSGFLIAGILMDGRNNPHFFRTFWTKRIARIFPVYYLMVGGGMLVAWLQAAYPTTIGAAIGFPGVPRPYLFFLQNNAMLFGSANGSPMVGVTWSLAIEEQFYLMLPFVIFFLSRRAVVALALLVVLSTPLIRGWVWSAMGWQTAYLLTPCRFDGLMLGVLLACIVRNPDALDFARRRQVTFNYVAVALIVMQLGGWDKLGTAALSVGAPQVVGLSILCLAYTTLSLAASLLLLNVFTRDAGPLRRIFKSRLLVGAGTVSYGAYMYHQTVNYGLWAAIGPTGMKIETPAQLAMPLVVLTLTFVLAWLSYRYFEMPIRNSASVYLRRQVVRLRSAPIPSDQASTPVTS